MAAGHSSTGNFTPAHADGCGARCFAGVQCASIFDLPVCHRPQSARVRFAARCGSLAPGGDGHGVPAVWLDTGQNVSVCLMLAPEASRRAFFVKEL